MDSGKAGVTRTVSKYKDNEITLFWTHHETQLRTISSKEPYQESGKGKDNMSWLGNIIQWTDMDSERVLRATDDRSQWRRGRSMVRSNSNPRIQDDWSQVKSDYYAKFGCPVSHIVCTHVRGPINFGDAGPSTLLLAWLNYRNTPPSCYLDKFGHSRSSTCVHRACRDLRKKWLWRPSFQGHSRSWEATRIDWLPIISY